MQCVDSTIGTIAVGILMLFLVYIILKMLTGMRKGAWRQLITTGVTFLSAVISYVVSVIISNKIVGSLKQDSFDGLIEYVNGIESGAGDSLRETIASMNLELLEYLTLIPATIILIPIFTVALFVAINLLLQLIKAIVFKILKVKKAKNNTDRLLGAILGGLQALICATIFLLPFTSVANMTERVYESAMENIDREDQKDLKETYTDYIQPFTQNPAITFIGKCGSRPIYNGIATIKLDGKKVNLRNEIIEITDLVLEEYPVLKNASATRPNEKAKNSISNILDAVQDSPFLSTLLVDLVQSSSAMIKNDVIDLEMGGNYQSLFDDLLIFLEGVEKATLENDLDTIKKLYFTIADSGVLSAALDGEDLMELLQERRKEGDDTVKNIVDILQANDRTAPLVTSLTEALIATLSTNIDLGGDVTVTYDEIKTGMNDVLAVKKDHYDSEEEYKEVLTGTLDTTLRDHGIELETEIVEDIADYIDTNYSDKQEFTDEEFNDVLLHYYDAYLYYVENGNIPEFGVPEN